MSHTDLHEESASTPFTDVIRHLTSALGLGYVAKLAAVTETRSVREWADGVRVPRGDTETRLRLAFWVVRALQQNPSFAASGSLRPWFELPNPKLDWATPENLIRDGVVGVVGPQLLATVQASDPNVVPLVDPTRQTRR